MLKPVRRKAILSIAAGSCLLFLGISQGLSQSIEPRDSTRAPKGREFVPAPSVREPRAGEWDRSVQIEAPADVCWEVKITDLPATEVCGGGSVDFPAPLGASGPVETPVEVMKTKGEGPMKVLVRNGRSEVLRSSTVSDSEPRQRITLP